MRSRSIRSLGWIGIVLLMMATLTAPAVAPDAPLRVLGDQRGVIIGSAVNSEALANDPGYQTLLGEQFSSITLENELKWDVVAPMSGRFDWIPADRAVEFALAHDQLVRGHTLVWHSQTPEWVRGQMSPQLLNTLREHIDSVVGRYAGRISSWDVVNEPLESDGSLRDSFWKQKLGDSYIAQAFYLARNQDPEAKLYLNEYGAETFNEKSNGLFELMRRLLAEGVPVDGVGFQSHFLVGEIPDDFAANLQRFVDLGVEVAITELDVRLRLPASPSDLAQQADDYRSVLRSCLAVAGCTSVTTWGFTDRSSWVSEAYPGWGAALPWGERLDPKPARKLMGQALVWQ